LGPVFGPGRESPRVGNCHGIVEIVRMSSDEFGCILLGDFWEFHSSKVVSIFVGNEATRHWVFYGFLDPGLD